jgi:hypothetical protein
MKLDRVMYDVLTAGSKNPTTLSEMLAGFTGDARNRMVAYFVELQNGGLVSLDPAKTENDYVTEEDRELVIPPNQPVEIDQANRAELK